MSVVDFYDGLAPEYEVVYGGDWEGAVERHGRALAALIAAAGPGARDVLDCSCGIGTQAIGLARRGFRVAGTDLSPAAVERARREAARLGVEVPFAVADFRALDAVPGDFDVVLSYDNAVPHLLDDAEVVRALRSMRSKLRPGGLLAVGIRDYDEALATRPQVAPPQLSPGPPRRLLARIHDWDAPGSPLHTVRFFVLTEGEGGWTLAQHAVRYRAITRAELARCAAEAGFTEIAWQEPERTGLGQPVLTASPSAGTAPR